MSIILAEKFNRLMVCMISLCLAVSKSKQQHPEPAENTNKTRILGYPVSYVVANLSRVAELDCSLTFLATGAAIVLVIEDNIPRGRIFPRKRAYGLWKEQVHGPELCWQPAGGLMSCKAGL